MKHELAIAGNMNSNYKRIFENLGTPDYEFKGKSDDELYAESRKEVADSLASFFGIEEEISLEEFATVYFEPTAQELYKDLGDEVKKKEDLTARTEEENLKRYEEAHHIFERKVAEAKNLTEPSWSKSNEYVKTESSSGYSEKGSTARFRELEKNRNSSSRGFGSTTSQSSSSRFGNNNDTTKRTESQEPQGAMSAFGAMNAEVQNIGRQRIKGWNDKSEEEIGYFEAYAQKAPWWKKAMRKTKLFFKSRKGKITMKVAILLALNMAMAVYSKRYQFEDGKQMVAMFGFMMASFFITRELSEDGVELGGFGF